jgi:hypothetical protein
MHHLIVINSITLIKHLLKSTNHKPTHSAAFFLMRSITLFGTLFPIGQARQTNDHAIYVCVCRQIASCKLWQAAFKKYPPPPRWGGGGGGGPQISRQYKTPAEITIPYTLILMFLGIIRNYGFSVSYVTTCNPAVDYIRPLYSSNVIACPMKRIPEAGACQLSLSCHCLPSVDKEMHLAYHKTTLYLSLWAKHVIAHVRNTSCWPVLELEWECLRTRN